MQKLVHVIGDKIVLPEMPLEEIAEEVYRYRQEKQGARGS